MSKLNEAAATPEAGQGHDNAEGKKEEKEEEEEEKDVASSEMSQEMTRSEDDRKDILRFMMLFNKYNSDLEDKHGKDLKYVMFFNKDVSISSEVEAQASEGETPRSIDRNNRKPRFSPKTPQFGQPQVSEPGMMFCSSFTSSHESFDKKPQRIVETENVKKLIAKRNSKTEVDSPVQLNVHPAARADLRNYNSLTSLPKNKSGVNGRGTLKSKIPSLTALGTVSTTQKASITSLGQWDHWDDLDRRLNLQISWSSNDNTRRSAARLKKEEAASVSDSKLIYADSECKRQIKKCDKKSRGDSSRKERDPGGRKQVQWKTEVDVIYFSSHLAANGDRTGEVIGRVMEPLREEWEQQRKGFYAKMVPCHLETHLKYRFISLLQI